MPTPFVTDTFTAAANTNLSAHTPDTGGSWAYATGNSGAFVITSAGRIRNGLAYAGTVSNAQSIAVESVSSTGNPVTVTWDLYVASPLSYSFFAVGIGATGAATYSGYEARADITGGQWAIYKAGSGTPAATAPFTFTAGQTYHCQFVAPDPASSTIKTLYVNGSAVVSLNDNSLTTTGRVFLDASNYLDASGNYAATDTTGLHIDNINIYNSAFTPGTYTTLPPDSTGIVLSPGNQYIVPGTSLQWIHTATSAKFNFTGTSLTANIDLSLLTAGSIATATYPYLNWSIDGATWQRAQAAATVSLATALAVGTHTAEVRLEPLDESNTWTPYSAIKITGWTVDQSSTISTPTGNATARPKKAMLFGDSISRGYAASNLSLLSYGVLLGHALNAEIGIVGYSGQGWDHPATNAAPDFRSTFGKYDSTHTTTYPTLDYLLINQGTNYNGGDLSTIIPTQLTTIRTAVGYSPIIVVILPFDGGSTTAITNAVNSYISSSFDKKVTLVDLTTRHYGFLNSGGNPPIQYSVDGLHPTTECHALLAADIAKAIGQFETSLSTASYSPSSAGGVLAGL